MADPQNIIAEAFEKLKRSLSQEDAHKFASTELKDVWSAVRNIDNKQRNRQSAQNLRRIEPFLRGIEKYTKVIEVLCNGTPYMPYVWAPIGLMLEIASHHRDVFEVLLSAYADIGAALPRFDRYQKAFGDNLELPYVLAAVYTEILEFHQHVYKFFRRRAWNILFLPLWKDFGSRFDCIISSLKKQRDFVDVEATFDAVEAKGSHTRLRDEIQQRQNQLGILEDNEKKTRFSQLQHSIAWLSDDEKIQETEYERTLNRRHDRTCEWITNEPQLKNWIKDDTTHPCLWLDGKPGSGKSVMCSYIIQTLTNIPGLTPCYYFCNSQDTGNVCHQILTIIVLQILRQHPDICTLVANEFVYRGASSNMTQLRILVPRLLEIIPYTRIVIDGINECSKEIQKSIWKELQVIYTSPTTPCKVLFSCRREVYIHEKLSEQPQFSLDERQEVDWDIRSFVKHKITKLQTSDQDLLTKIESILVEKANGTFSWVRLVSEELQCCYTDAALEEMVVKLPNLRGMLTAIVSADENFMMLASQPGPATDSGYASVGMSQEKSMGEQDDGDTQTIRSDDQELEIQEDLKSKLTAAFAEELCQSLQSVLYQRTSFKHVDQEILAELLKEFAIKLRYIAQHGQQQDATVFVRQQRGRIAASFEKNIRSMFSEIEDENQDIQRPGDTDRLSWKEKVFEWNPTNADVFEESTSDFVSNVENGVDDEDYSITELSEARKFLFESRAYQWLIEKLRAEFVLTDRKGTALNEIRYELLRGLAVYPRRSGYNLLTPVAEFQIVWSPISFLSRQFPHTSAPALGEIIVLNGAQVDAQASTCAQYIQQTWTATGVEILRLLERVVARGVKGEAYERPLSDGSRLKITLNESTILVIAFGSEPALAEIGELLAWIGAALRESPNGNTMTYSTPRMTTKTSPRLIFTLDAVMDDLEPEYGRERRNGTCWHHLFRNPVIVRGSPILTRGTEEKGLEIPLGVMAGLGRTSRATVFDYGLVMKGFSTMFVPVKCVKNSVIWHFLFHEDETRIPYLSASKLCHGRLSSDSLDASGIEDARNFLGWSSSVEVCTGSKSVKYEEIEWTNNYATAGCAFEKVSISAGKIINAGVTFARGVKDTPLYLSRAGAYEQEIHHSGSIYVVLYDAKDRRGWLVDGASALLHLTCTQLSTVWSRKSRLLNIEQFRFAVPRMGTSAATVALLDQWNRELAIFEEVDSWKEVTTTVGDPAIGLDSVIKEEHKKKTTSWCYQDLVRQTYHILELMHDYQVKVSTCPGTNIRFTDREKLEGFAFMDIVDGPPSAILPRVATLMSSGRGWVDFTRSIHAITLLGKGFGELIKVAENSNKLCKSWQRVPTGQDYLVACISTLREICKKEGDREATPMELARDIYWHKAHMMFEPCVCKVSHRKSACDRIQVLLPPSLGPKRHPHPFNHLNGAVIFGRSNKFRWSWPGRGDPTEGGDSDQEVNEQSTMHDSGLGTSVRSSSSNDENSATDLSSTPVSSTSPSLHHTSPAMISGAPETEAVPTTSTRPIPLKKRFGNLNLRYRSSTMAEASAMTKNDKDLLKVKRTWEETKEKASPASSPKRMKADSSIAPAKIKTPEHHNG